MFAVNTGDEIPVLFRAHEINIPIMKQITIVKCHTGYECCPLLTGDCCLFVNSKSLSYYGSEHCPTHHLQSIHLIGLRKIGLRPSEQTDGPLSIPVKLLWGEITPHKWPKINGFHWGYFTLLIGVITPWNPNGPCFDWSLGLLFKGEKIPKQRTNRFQVHLHSLTDIAPENRPSQKELVFQPLLLRGYVSFKEGVTGDFGPTLNDPHRPPST